MQFHFHLVSDATGETILSVAHAAVAQFEEVEAIEHIWALVRSTRQMDRVLAAIEANPGVVIYTLVDSARRDHLTLGCQKLGVPCVPVLDPVLGVLSTYLGQQVKGLPGEQHTLDAEYFARVDAIQFVLRHDDGQSPHDLDEANVIVVGVSRTSRRRPVSISPTAVSRPPTCPSCPAWRCPTNCSAPPVRLSSRSIRASIAW